MKYTLYGKNYRYRGFRLDAAIILICILIGATALAALVFRTYIIMWGILCLGVALNVLLAVKNAVHHYIVQTIVFGIIAAGLAAAVVLDGIHLFA